MENLDVAWLTSLNILFFLLAVTCASFNSDNVLFQLQFPGASSPGQVSKYSSFGPRCRYLWGVRYWGGITIMYRTAQGSSFFVFRGEFEFNV